MIPHVADEITAQLLVPSHPQGQVPQIYLNPPEQPLKSTRTCPKWWKYFRVNPVAVDRYSRVMFPLTVGIKKIKYA